MKVQAQASPQTSTVEEWQRGLLASMQPERFADAHRCQAGCATGRLG